MEIFYRLYSQDLLDEYFETYPKEKANYKIAKTFIRKMKDSITE